VDAVDDDGQVLASYDQVVADADTPWQGVALEKVVLRESRRGDVRVVAWTERDDADAADIAVSVVDADGNSLLDATTATPAGMETRWSEPALTFAEPDNVVDMMYRATLTFTDADGALVEEAEAFVVAGSGAASWTGASGEGLLTLSQNDDGETATLSIAAPVDAAGLTVQLTPEDGGSDADPETLELALGSAWEKWSATGSGGVGDTPVTVSVDVQDAGDGSDTIVGTVVGAPTIVLGFGSGTKRSTTNTSAKPELL
jgi:hypothetical protein